MPRPSRFQQTCKSLRTQQHDSQGPQHLFHRACACMICVHVVQDGETQANRTSGEQVSPRLYPLLCKPSCCILSTRMRSVAHVVAAALVVCHRRPRVEYPQGTLAASSKLLTAAYPRARSELSSAADVCASCSPHGAGRFCALRCEHRSLRPALGGHEAVLTQPLCLCMGSPIEQLARNGGHDRYVADSAKYCYNGWRALQLTYDC